MAAPAARRRPRLSLRSSRAEPVGSRACPPDPGDRLPFRRHRDRLRRNAADARAGESRSSRSTGSCWRRRASAARRRARAPRRSRQGSRPRESRCIAFRDGFLPYVGGEVKEVFEDLKARVDPQIVFTHAGYDFHQDHRLASRADVEHVPEPPDPRVRDPEVRRRPRQAERLRSADATRSWTRSSRCSRSTSPRQRGKHWFDRETFLALMRLRGLESVAPERFAEAFTARKVVVSA